MSEEAIISSISNLGFPIAMCLWFMFRTEKVIGKNTEVMEKVLEKL